MNKPRTTSPTGGPLRVLGYIRVSTDEQKDHGLSLQHQPQHIKEELDRRFGPGGYELIEIESDEGISGSYGPSALEFYEFLRSGRIPRKHRPGLLRVLQAIHEDRVDVIAVYNFSRLARDAYLQQSIIREMIKPKGIDLISVMDKVSIYDASGMLTTNIMGSVHSFELERTNDVVVTSIRKRKVSGLHHGTAPYSWRYTNGAERDAGMPRTIVPISEQAVIVKRIAELFLAGHSLKAIADLLNAEGIPFHGKKRTKKAGAAKYALENYEKLWDAVKIEIVLRCPAHAGLLLLDGQLEEGFHVQFKYYDREQYELIQVKLKERQKRYKNIKSEKPEMLLANVGQCSCGGLLHVRFTNTNRAYTCRGLKRDAVRRHVWVSAAQLEAVVLQEVEKLAMNPELLAECELRIGQELVGHLAEAAREQATLQQRLENLREQRSTGLRQLREGILGERDYKELATQIAADEAFIEKRLQELAELLADSKTHERLQKRALEALQSFPLCWSHLQFCERAEFMRSAIEYLKVEQGEGIPVVTLKLYLMPEVTITLPRNNTRVARTLTSGFESLTAREAAALWYHLRGEKPSLAAAKMGISRATFSVLASRGAERLGEESPKVAARKYAKYLQEKASFLPLVGSKKKTA